MLGFVLVWGEEVVLLMVEGLLVGSGKKVRIVSVGTGMASGAG